MISLSIKQINQSYVRKNKTKMTIELTFSVCGGMVGKAHLMQKKIASYPKKLFTFSVGVTMRMKRDLANCFLFHMFEEPNRIRIFIIRIFSIFLF